MRHACRFSARPGCRPPRRGVSVPVGRGGARPTRPERECGRHIGREGAQALDRVVSVRFDRQMIPEALAELGEQAKLHIVLDGPATQQFGVAPGQARSPYRRT